MGMSDREMWIVAWLASQCDWNGQNWMSSYLLLKKEENGMSSVGCCWNDINDCDITHGLHVDFGIV